MDYFGRAKISFTHAAEPLQLPTKKGAAAAGTTATTTGAVDLAGLVRDCVPVCQLNPLLANGHLQTMWTAVARGAPDVYYRRRIFEAEHAGFAGSFAVDFAVAPHSDHDAGLPPRTAYFADDAAFAALASDDRRPMLLVLHGLSGGSHEVYLRHCIAPLLAGDDADHHDEDGAWAVAVVNSRGCAQSEVTSGMLFNARATWDVRQVAAWARRTFPNRPLFGLGFSLGANILTNYVGEEGADCPLAAAVAVAAPFDLQLSNKALQRNFVGRHVYEPVMATALKKLVHRHRDALARYTALDLDRVAQADSLHAFDRVVQCTLWGYPTEDAYYRDASSVDAVLNIRIPFFALQAQDDPIAVAEAVPHGEFRCNPYTVLCETSLGGHLSWFEPAGGRWHARPVCAFLRKMATEVDLAAVPRDRFKVAHQRPGVVYQPVLRKLQIDADAQQG